MAAYRHLHRTGSLAGTAVIGGAQRKHSSTKSESRVALGHSQGEAENPLENPEGRDGLASESWLRPRRP